MGDRSKANLLKPLLDVQTEAEPGTEYVLTRYRDRGVNLRTHLNRIIRLAGLEPWPKLFHNLRASRETELNDEYPEHVVCRWIGNSRKVARKHYLRPTDAHLARAVAQNQNPAQNPAQQDSAGDAVEGKSKGEAVKTAQQNTPCIADGSGKYPRQGSNLRPPV